MEERSMKKSGSASSLAAALCVCAVFASLATAGGAESVGVTVKGARVNLRARPAMDAEVVGQSEEGEVLTARRSDEEWVEVAPPERIDVWVHRDFVREGIVQTSSLQVRSGPGINYQRVGTLHKGERVSARGEFGEWLKIAPPADVSLWVHRDFVQWPAPPKPPVPPKETVRAPVPPPPPPKPVPRPPAVAESRPVSEPKPPPPPADLRLAPAAQQGRLVQREGYVKPVGFLFGRPSRFQLAVDRGNRLETLCYLRGNDDQLAGFQNRLLRIEGREYWVQGVRHPMLVIERIRLINP
jgi:uncharacterized protein YraI